MARPENSRDNFVEVEDCQSYCDTYERVVHGLDWPDTYRFRAVRKNGAAFDAEATIVPLTYGGHKLAYHFGRPVPAAQAQALGPAETIRRFQDAWVLRPAIRASLALPRRLQLGGNFERDVFDQCVDTCPVRRA